MLKSWSSICYKEYSMKCRYLLIILFSVLSFSMRAQDATSRQDTSVANTVKENMEIFARHEIKLMDSLLNVWYVKRDLANQNSILSKLTDDTTKYDNNDSLIFKRLSQINSPIKVAYNDRVKRFIELYSVQRQRSSSVVLGLAQYYYPWMKAIFDKYGLPEELVYITIIESALNPTAVSPAGATGIWQFMYGTGKLYGLEVTSYVDDRRDPYKATEAAARHFRDLYNIFGDWGLAISAYNCGAGNVRKAIQRSGGKTDFWGVCNYLPRETQNYFPAFIGAMYMMTYHNLYGIQPAKISIPSDVDTVMINSETHFRQIAEVLNVSYDEIKSLNPQYKREIIPAFNNKPMPLRLQSNDVLKYIAMSDSVSKYNYDLYFSPTKNLNLVASTNTSTEEDGTIVQKTPNKYHIVKRGETLGKIAAKYHTSVSAIKSMNHMRSTYLRAGQRLLVKKGTTVRVPNPNPKPKPTTTQDTVNAIAHNQTVSDSTNTAATATPKPTPQIKPVQKQVNYTSYTIRQGDTLTSIARRYGTTANDIAQYNNLSNKDAIKIGQKLKIPKK